MSLCPACGATTRQRKNGFNPSGTQRWYWNACGRISTPTPAPNGSSRDLHQQAVQVYADGLRIRRIGRTLGGNHQTVANCIRAYAATLPPAPQPEEPPAVIEMDALDTFVGAKKPCVPHNARRPCHTLQCGLVRRCNL